ATLGGAKNTTDSTTQALALQNPLFEVLSPNVFQTETGQFGLANGPMVGMARLRDTAKVNQYLNDPLIQQIIPGNVHFMWAVKPESFNREALALYAIKAVGNEGPVLSGNVVIDARDEFDPMTNSPMVTMTMNSVGAREWRRITANASADPNNRKAIAIVLDNVVYSAPVVGGEIPNGVSSITGNFTIEDTKDLANVLKAGRLPTTAKIVEEAVVGPTLGQAAINAGVTSAIVGLVVV